MIWILIEESKLCILYNVHQTIQYSDRGYLHASYMKRPGLLSCIYMKRPGLRSCIWD
jgi:hypothetical protein